jgi:antitoxin HigA-1
MGDDVEARNVMSDAKARLSEMAVRLEKPLGSTAEGWVQMQTNYELAQIRKRVRSIRVKRIAPRIDA